MADVDIGGLRATLTIDGKEFEQGLKKAEDQTTQFQNKTEDLNTSLINLASGIYVAQQAYYYASTALTMFTNSTINAYDQVDAFNRLTGTSIEEGGKWKDMLERMNLSLSDMTYTFRSFSNNLQTAMADPNSSTARAFKQLGIVLTDNKGQLKDNNQLMIETIAAFQKMPDGMQKTALAFDILGRGAININKLLKEGKDIVTDYGAAISNETEAGKDKVDKFKLAWAEYNDVLEDTKSKLGEGLLPAFTTFVNFITNSVLPILDELGSRFERIGYVIGAYMNFGNKISAAQTPAEREAARQEFMADLSGDIDEKFLGAKELSYTAPSEEKQKKMLTTISQKVRGYGKLTAEEIEWASKYSPNLLNEYNTKVASWKPTEYDIESARQHNIPVETLSPYYTKPTSSPSAQEEVKNVAEWMLAHPTEQYPGTSGTQQSVPVTVTQPVTTQPVLPQTTVTENKPLLELKKRAPEIIETQQTPKMPFEGFGEYTEQKIPEGFISFEAAQEELSKPIPVVISQPPLAPTAVQTQPISNKIPEAMTVTEKGATPVSYKPLEEEINARLSGLKVHAASIQTKKQMNMEYAQEELDMLQDLGEAQIFLEQSNSDKIKNIRSELLKEISADNISKINEILDESLAATMVKATDATERYKESIKDLAKLKHQALDTDREYAENIQRAGRDVGQMRDLTIAYKRTKREQQETFQESTQRAQEAGAIMIQSGGSISKDTWNITINASKDYPIDKIIADVNAAQEAERRRKGIPTGG